MGQLTPINPMTWTDEAVARLCDLWNAGLPATAIGRALGLSKNAVIGKAHRLQLPARPSPIVRNGRTPIRLVRGPVPSLDDLQPGPDATAQTTAKLKRATGPNCPTKKASGVEMETEPHLGPARQQGESAARAHRASPAATQTIEAPTSAGDLLLRGTSDWHCCWPTGEPGTPGFRFCEQPALNTKPYCAEHARRAYCRPNRAIAPGVGAGPD